jgi:IS4 transposase
LLGTPGVNQTEKELRVVGYQVDDITYWVATSRYDLSAEEIALICKLRWEIEKFFAWWEHHLKLYHLTARSPYGLLVQILLCLLLICCLPSIATKTTMKRYL